MSEKLRKYLAYYQRVLKAEPENIEARLRLAAIFREMGRDSHAVEEYVTASKLLAKEGLPLEAIAACKAVLELDPNQTEVQYFLARLFAHVPEAMDKSARVAQPVDPMAVRQTPVKPTSAVTPRERESPITLGAPKEIPSGSIADARSQAPQPPEMENAVLEPDGLANEPTSPLDEDDDDNTSPLKGKDVPEFEPQPATAVTKEYGPNGPPPPPLEVTQNGVHNATTRPVRPLVPDHLLPTATYETFEVNVFDMDSLGLDESSGIDFEFLDAFEGEVADFASAEVSESMPAVFEVSREDLPAIPLLSDLPADVFMRLLAVIDLQRVPAGTTILRPDHTSRTLYIVVRGRALVTRRVDDKEVELAAMEEGDFFGEFMLLTGRTGSASVRAQTDCELLAIHENVVNDIGEEHPEIWDALWDFYYARMLNNLLASSEIFAPLEMRERAALAAKFEMVEVVSNEVFLREGEPCRHLHLILNGEVAVERRVSGLVQTLVTLREGEFFGIASSLNDEPYLADLRATRDTVILRLPSEEFRGVADTNPAVDAAVQSAIMSRRALNSAFLSGITAYAELGVAKAE